MCNCFVQISKPQFWKAEAGGGIQGVVDQRRATAMIHVAHFRSRLRSGLINRVWLAVAISLFSCAASAETYPVSGVWVAKADRFPGSTAGACLLLKEFGVDALVTQSFPRLIIFSEDKRFEVVQGDFRAERTIRSVKSATDGSFQITESPGKRWLPFSKRSFTLRVVDPTTIEITEGKISSRFFKCSARSQSL
jgi:hypothetical protein